MSSPSSVPAKPNDPDQPLATAPFDLSPAAITPTRDEQIGHALAAEIHDSSAPQDRPTATRDLVHEMIRAGAEGEVATDLLQQEELPPEPFTDTDYEDHEAASEVER